MLRFHLSQVSSAAEVSSANAVTSRCDSGAPNSKLCCARFDDRKAADAVDRSWDVTVRSVPDCSH